MERSLGFSMMRWMKGMMFKHMPFMITCIEFEDFIIDYLEGDLSERQRTVFEFHLRICRECREYLAAYRRTMEVSKMSSQSDRPRLPDSLPDDLIKAIREARKA
ncbi:MAG: anti-sigma factor family protein [Geminicoccales bacterium]